MANLHLVSSNPETIKPKTIKPAGFYFVYRYFVYIVGMASVEFIVLTIAEFTKDRRMAVLSAWGAVFAVVGLVSLIVCSTGECAFGKMSGRRVVVEILSLVAGTLAATVLISSF